jgi:hypothetical protein
LKRVCENNVKTAVMLVWCYSWYDLWQRNKTQWMAH